MRKRTVKARACALVLALSVPLATACTAPAAEETARASESEHVSIGESVPTDDTGVLHESEEESMSQPTLSEPYQYKSEVNEAVLDTNYDPAYLLLVNKEHPLGADYVPPQITQLTCNTTYPMELETRTAAALYEMLREMRADGLVTDGEHYDVAVTSAYRTYRRQAELFERYVRFEMTTLDGFSQDAYLALGDAYIKEHYISKGILHLSEADARRVVMSYSAVAGSSEHQSGLCVDFITSDMNGALTTVFEEKAAFAWLSQNAHRFGFILRYPADGEAITGYTYEPWHYRFVGREAAGEIYRAGLTLEEYLLRRGTEE